MARKIEVHPGASPFWQKVSLGLKRAGLTQDALARQIGATTPQLSVWLKGDTSPSLARVQAIAHTLRLSPSYLIDDSIPVDQPVEYGKSGPTVTQEEEEFLRIARKIGLEEAERRLLNTRTVEHDVPTVRKNKPSN